MLIITEDTTRSDIVEAIRHLRETITNGVTPARRGRLHGMINGLLDAMEQRFPLEAA